MIGKHRSPSTRSNNPFANLRPSTLRPRKTRQLVHVNAFKQQQSALYRVKDTPAPTLQTLRLRKGFRLWAHFHSDFKGRANKRGRSEKVERSERTSCAATTSTLPSSGQSGAGQVTERSFRQRIVGVGAGRSEKNGARK